MLNIILSTCHEQKFVEFEYSEINKKFLEDYFKSHSKISKKTKYTIKNISEREFSDFLFSLSIIQNFFLSHRFNYSIFFKKETNLDVYKQYLGNFIANNILFPVELMGMGSSTSRIVKEDLENIYITQNNNNIYVKSHTRFSGGNYRPVLEMFSVITKEMLPYKTKNSRNESIKYLLREYDKYIAFWFYKLTMTKEDKLHYRNMFMSMFRPYYMSIVKCYHLRKRDRPVEVVKPFNKLFNTNLPVIKITNLHQLKTLKE